MRPLLEKKVHVQRSVICTALSASAVIFVNLNWGILRSGYHKDLFHGHEIIGCMPT